MKLTLVEVKDNPTKLAKILEIVHKCYVSKETLLILVPSAEAATYIDQYLWKVPEEGFLPHVWTESQTKEKIAITHTHQNVNQAKTVLNLCPQVPPNPSQFGKIYDLFDRTHQEKEAASLRRRSAYRSLGFIETND